MLLDGKGLVAALRSQVKEVDCLALHHRLVADESLLFIDIREQKETDLGYPLGCELIPRGVLEMQLSHSAQYQSLVKLLPSASQLPIYLICRSGARSILAAASLQNMGYQQVYSLAGGFIEWQKKGLKIQNA